MKKINIPFIDKIHELNFHELDLALEKDGRKIYIDELNWSQEYPYMPSTSVRIARSASHLVVGYNVRGLDLRAKAGKDNGPVWEDSCCEFFVAHPSDGTYYNFEINCVGTLLCAKRTGRHDANHLSQEELDKVIRHSSLERAEIEISDEIFEWSVTMCIPFDIIDVDAEDLPESLSGNFYKCGDKTAHPHFVSWNKIDVEKPDFHRPDFFGELIFKERA